jgi:hypothetical protein
MARETKRPSVHSFAEVPPFSSEEEEASWWDSAELADEFFANAEPASLNDLPPLRVQNSEEAVLKAALEWNEYAYPLQCQSGVLSDRERVLHEAVIAFTQPWKAEQVTKPAVEKKT